MDRQKILAANTIIRCLSGILSIFRVYIALDWETCHVNCCEQGTVLIFTLVHAPIMFLCEGNKLQMPERRSHINSSVIQM